MELDEVGSHKRGARSGLLTRPGAVGWPLGEVSPIQSTEQGAILLGDGAGGDEGRERRLRLGQRLGSDAVERPDGGLGRVGRTQGRHSPVEEVAEQCAQVVERSSEVRYHSDVSSSGGEVVVTRSYRCWRQSMQLMWLWVVAGRARRHQDQNDTRPYGTFRFGEATDTLSAIRLVWRNESYVLSIPL